MHVTVAMPSSRAKAGDLALKQSVMIALGLRTSWLVLEEAAEITDQRELRAEPEQAQTPTDVDLWHWLHTRKHCATADVGRRADITPPRLATHKISIYYNCQTSAST